MSSKNSPSKEETIYDRVSKLEDEIATLRNEVDVIKNAFRNELKAGDVVLVKGSRSARMERFVEKIR